MRMPITSSGLGRHSSIQFETKKPRANLRAAETLATLRRQFSYIFEKPSRETSVPRVDVHEIDGPFEFIRLKIRAATRRHMEPNRCLDFARQSGLPDRFQQRVGEFEVAVARARRRDSRRVAIGAASSAFQRRAIAGVGAGVAAEARVVHTHLSRSWPRASECAASGKCAARV